ncbi:MAG: hypothetical protein ABJ327_06210, partial [Litoreibacter sp.]
LERRYASYAAERGATVTPPPQRDEDIFDRVEAEARVEAEQTQEIGETFVAPREDQNASGATPPPDAIVTPSNPDPAPTSETAP